MINNEQPKNMKKEIVKSGKKYQKDYKSLNMRDPGGISIVGLWQ